MELMMLVAYAGICVLVFKLFKIPLNKWSVPTAILGGVLLLVGSLLVMNYNHPHTKLATQYYISTPIVPNVKGTVIEVNNSNPNELIKKGDILFKLDPTPYQAEVNAKKAELADAEKIVASLEADLKVAEARIDEAKFTLDQKKKEIERYRQLVKTDGVSRSEVEIKEREYLVAKANFEARKAELDKTKGIFMARIDGEHTNVAQKKALLEKAEFDLNSTIITAPTDGYVVQNLLQPGMMATTLPLRPLMTFTHQQEKLFMAAFRQNSLLRLKAGHQAELAFPSIPGKVFQAEVVSILPSIGEHELQAGGTLYTKKFIDNNAMPLVILKVTSDMSEYNLPYGSTAEVAVYTEHFHHLAMMRKILLRMNSWKNYLYLDH